jgi:hypothetical protein
MTSSCGFRIACSATMIACLAPPEAITFSGATTRSVELLGVADDRLLERRDAVRGRVADLAGVQQAGRRDQRVEGALLLGSPPPRWMTGSPLARRIAAVSLSLRVTDSPMGGSSPMSSAGACRCSSSISPRGSTRPRDRRCRGRGLHPRRRRARRARAHPTPAGRARCRRRPADFRRGPPARASRSGSTPSRIPATSAPSSAPPPPSAPARCCLSPGCADHFHPAAVRGSAGAVFRLPISRDVPPPASPNG